MSIELMYGLENMFWPVDNSAQIATEREEFYDEQEELYIERQDGLVSKIEEIKKLKLFSKLQKNYLDDVLDNSGLQWMYNGISNVATTDINYLLNPEEIVKLYAGVWRYKELRDFRNKDLKLPSDFNEMIPYLIGMGNNTLGENDKGERHFTEPDKKFNQERNHYSSPLENRLTLIPDCEKNKFMCSLMDKIKVPGKDFFIPESRKRSGLDATARNVYLKETIRQVYRD